MKKRGRQDSMGHRELPEYKVAYPKGLSGFRPSDQIGDIKNPEIKETGSQRRLERNQLKAAQHRLPEEEVIIILTKSPEKVNPAPKPASLFIEILV